MADSAALPGYVSNVSANATSPRHTATVRVTHWITTVCFFALLVSGIELIISHPRFYWGEAGNVLTPSLFDIPIPASRGGVKTGYNYVLPDQNGWSRGLHFQSAWLLVFTGLVYLISGSVAGHFRKNLFPSGISWKATSASLSEHLRFKAGESQSYNVLQRLSYSVVIFVLFPLMIWTGLAMSPGFTSAFPLTVTVFGGQQSARTIHFFITLLLTLFVVVHVAMVALAGFTSRMRAMITGHASNQEHQ
jgi:thiosulfate reductase cytochrome b subunit